MGAIDAALAEQLELEAADFPATTGPGHAAARYLTPTTGGDIMPSIRAELHRLAPVPSPVGSTVLQVVVGSGSITLGQDVQQVEPTTTSTSSPSATSRSWNDSSSTAPTRRDPDAPTHLPHP